MEYIDLSNSEIIPLSILNNDEAKKLSNKGWSFSYVYHFSEIRDIYLVLKHTPFKKPKDIFNNIRLLNLPYEKTPWEERRILEQVNALKNFGLIDEDCLILKDVFIGRQIGSPLNEDDLKVFNEIYFSYFRFKEIHSWFINPKHGNILQQDFDINENVLIRESLPLFPFLINSRFTNAFLLNLKNSSEIFLIDKSKEDLMRFWDVYVKWGQALNLLEKFSLKELDIAFSTGQNSLTCIYFKKHYNEDFRLYDFIKSEYRSKYIQIPKLIFKIASRYRYPVDTIREIIIEQSLKNSEHFSLQRTSEIFIRNKSKIFFPQYKDMYISHLMLQD